MVFWGGTSFRLSRPFRSPDLFHGFLGTPGLRQNLPSSRAVLWWPFWRFRLRRYLPESWQGFGRLIEIRGVAIGSSAGRLTANFEYLTIRINGVKIIEEELEESNGC